MKNFLKVLVIVGLLFGVLSAKDIEAKKLCDAEVKKDKIDISIVKKECLKTAKFYESKKKYGSASWYYLLAGENDKNINKILLKIKNGNFANVAHSCILQNNLEKAKENYFKFLKNADIPWADNATQDDYKLLLKLYPNKKVQLQKGLKLWNEIYKPLLKINELYPKYKKARKEKKYKEAITYLSKVIEIQKKSNLQSKLIIANNKFSLGIVYYKNQEYKKALKTLLDIENIYKSKANKKDLANLYGWISNSYKNLQKNKEASTYYKKALEIGKKVLGENYISAAIDYNNIGFLYQDMGDNKQALSYYKKALEIYEKVLGKNHISTAKSYNNIASLYYYMGGYKQALSYYKKALEVFEKVLGKNHISTATSYNNIALLHQNMGNYKQALSYYKKALKIFEKVLGKNHASTATDYNNIAALYKAMGNYKQALSYYKKSLKIFEKVSGKNHVNTAISYDNIASLYKDMGNYKESLTYLKKALEIFEKVSGKNYIDTATSYNNIGGLYQDIGDYKQALSYYKKALEVLEKVLGKNHVNTAISYDNIASLYKDMGNYKEALTYLKKALEIFEKVSGKNHIDTAISYNNMGLLYKDMGYYKEALNYYKKALEINEKVLGKNHDSTAINYNNIGLLYYYMGSYEEAYIYAKKSYDIFLKNRDKNFQILSNKQKKLYLKSNSYKIPILLATAYLYGKKDPNKKPLLAKTTLNDWLNYKGSVFDSENGIAMLYEATKDKKLKAKIKELILAKRDLAKIYQNLPKTQKERETYQSRIKEANKKISELEQEIASKAIAFKEALGLRKVSYKNISKNLKDNELYIDYAKAGKNYYIFTLDNKENITFNQIDENTTKEIDKNVKAFREDINTIVKSNNLTKEELSRLQEHSKNILAKLYNLALSKPLKAILPKYSNLIISPDGALRLIPFEAMYDAKNNKYIIEEKNIKYTPSGKELIRLFKFAKATNAKNQSVVIANPDFNKNIKVSKKEEKIALTPNTNIKIRGVVKSFYENINIFNSLQGTKEEAKEIKKLLGKRVMDYEENNATEENLLSVKEPKILHIATHGFFINNKSIPNPMLKSGIALTGANVGIIKQNGTGIVTALKLSGLNLKGTNLVVLSACETGVVDINSTQSVSSLAKAFIQAGAKDIVMSLWSVNDKATKDLMVDFYKEILNSTDYTTALKKAKLKMIKQGMHPYFWAPFVLSGK